MVFSMATSHSGHTLLSLYLNAHPRITHLGDTLSSKINYKKRIFCSCGKRTVDCKFWQKIYAWNNFEFVRTAFPNNQLLKMVFYSPLFFVIQKKIVHNFPKIKKYVVSLLRFNSFVAQTTGSDIFVFGRKKFSDPLVVAASGTRIKIIHLTKSPLDFVVSHKKRYSGQSVEYFAFLWLRYNFNVYAIKTLRHLCDYIHIRFNDFCQEPELTLRRINDFLGIEYNEQMLHPIVFGNQHIIGADSVVKRKFTGIRTSATNLDILSKVEKAKVIKITLPLSRLLGY
jgi:hypothetical protein